MTVWLLTLSLASADAPAVQVQDTAPLTVDGVLDEEAWQNAQVVSDFLQFYPVSGGAPPGLTEIRVLQDEKYLYLGASVRDSPWPIRARLSRREMINADDQIGVLIDTFHDQRTGYIFFYNPLGIQQDLRFNNGEWNFFWDTVMLSEGTVTENGYDLEIAIPFRSLKYPKPEGEQDWGIMLHRITPQNASKYGFPDLDRGHPQLFAQAATLSGVKPAARGSGVEILPSFTGIQSWEREDPSQELAWTGLDPWHKTMRPSLDARIGLSPTVGLTATINPDFSQVEGDVTPIALNQRFAFYYPERRPFFLDGSEYFSRGITSRFRRKTSTIPSFSRSLNTLYSRSIVEPLGGIKLTGRTNKWSTGVLNVIDQSPAQTVNEATTPGFGEADVEGKQASNSVFRLKRDVGSDGHVAMTVSDKHLFDSLGVDGGNSLFGLDSRLALGKQWIGQGSSSHAWTGDATDQLIGSETYVQVRRSVSVGTGADFAFLDRTSDFRKETGFLNQSGHTTAYASVDNTSEFDGVITRYNTALSLLMFQERNGEFRRSVETQHALVANKIHNIQAAGSLNMHREADSDLNGWAIATSYRSRPAAALSVDVELSLERLLDYDTLRPAMVGIGELELDLRPLKSLQVSTMLELQRLQPESANTAFASLVRNTVQWQLTREWGLRLIVEHADTSDANPALTTSLLGTWMRHPGTALWFGYVESAQANTGFDALNRSVFLKGTFLFRT
jgi:hypothetical protein